MKALLSNPLFVGGVIPMFLLGIYGVLYKHFSQKALFSVLLLGVALGGIIVILGYNFWFAQKEFTVDFTLKNILIGMGIGVVWATSMLAMGYAFGKLNGNITQIAPIIAGSTAVTVVLGLLFLNESVVVWKILLGTIFMLLGVFFLV